MITIRDAAPADVALVMSVDPIAERGDAIRTESIQHWVAVGMARVAEISAGVVGYCVVERMFFGHEFVSMLAVDEHARRQGVGASLLRDVEQRCRTPKLFTSTNLSNHPMQSLLRSLGWRSVGIVYGLDEEDPELFFMAPRRS